jgi:hypothetical protein
MQGCSGYFKSDKPGALSRMRARFAMALAFLFSIPCSGAERSEAELKAMFFVTLARFTEWPTNAFSSADAPFVIGVLGENPFGRRRLEALVKSEKAHGRPIVVKEFGAVDDVKDCQLLFISTGTVVRRELILSRLGGKAILTVSDQSNFARDGGMVELFINAENKVRMRLSLQAIERAKLKLSPTLLRIAQQAAANGISYAPLALFSLRACLVEAIGV